MSPEGHAKVLDFGLAKLTEISMMGTSGDDRTQSPTMLGTVAGQVMGTAGYMAPEQVEGSEIDGRADVFAFGCVLYEMVTGQRPFAGRSVMATLDLIVHEDPVPLRQADARLPGQLQWILDKCLAKDRSRRYQGAADLAVDLRRLAADVESGAAGPLGTPAGAGGPGTADLARRGLSPLLIGAIVVGASLAAATATLWLTRTPAPDPRPVVLFDVPLSQGVGFGSTGRTVVAVSRDGHRLAFSANDLIWTRAMDDLEAVPVRGTEGNPGGRNAVFSPDGAQIAFWAEDELRKVPAVGGAALRIADAGNPWGLYWEPDGFLYYGQGSDGIWRVNENGEEPEQLVALEPGQQAHGGQPLPGGWVLFTLLEGASQWDAARIVAQSTTGERVELINPGRDGRYLPSGHLVYALGTDLLVVPFDATSRDVLGGSVAVVEGVRDSANVTATSQYGVSATGTLAYLPGNVRGAGVHELAWVDRAGQKQPTAMAARTFDPGAMEPPSGAASVVENVMMASQGFTGAANYGFSDNGRLIYVPGNVAAEGFVLAWVDRDGRAEALPFGPRDSSTLDLSPDGQRVALQIQGGVELDIWIYELARGGSQVLLTTAGNNETPVWSPDGEWVFFASDRGGNSDIWKRRADRSLDAELVLDMTAPVAPMAISPDGTLLLFYRGDFSNSDAGVLSLNTEEEPQLLLATAASEAATDFSPDGNYFAFHSDETGQYEAYVWELASGRTFPVSTRARGGFMPRWSRDGHQIYFASGNGPGLLVAEVTMEPFSASEPVELNGPVRRYGSNFDLANNGQRLLVTTSDSAVLASDASAPGPRIRVILNWFEELRQRVPTGR